MSYTRSIGSWQEWVSKAYFDLEISSPVPAAFEADLTSWEAGDFGLSVNRSTSLLYRRRKESCRREPARFLATVPIQGEIQFSQFRRQVHCGAGGYVLEASDEPYEFSQGTTSQMLVFRANESALRDRVHAAHRFYAIGLDGRQGLGAMFVDFLTLSSRHIAKDPDRLLPRVGPQLLDLLALALEDAPQAINSSLSAVKAAHLTRIDHYIGQHLPDPDLALDDIARACGVSLRYLHRLFHDAGSTGRQWIRDRRLRLAHDLLERSPAGLSIATLAYRVGFSDQAHFSRSFKSKFGHSPSEHPRRHRLS